KAARTGGNYLKVLELGEDVLSANPWDLGAQMAMGEAAEELGLLDMAIWLLDQARQKDAQHVGLNRALARLLEKRGLVMQAIKLWELVRKADPSDQEAASKAKDLAASETIARGQYEAVTSQAEQGTALDRSPPAAPPPPPAKGPSTKSSATLPALKDPALAPPPARPAGPPPRPAVGGH